MTVRCPHCQTKIVFRYKRGYGQIYTHRGLPIEGGVSEAGSALPGSESLGAYYDLTSAEYGIIGCYECNREFIVNHLRQVLFPLAGTIVAPEIPSNVREAFVDAKKAHAAGAEMAALLAARTALIRMQREQECSKIKDLVDKGKITQLLWGQADEVRQWANATGHDEDPPTPSKEGGEQLLGYIELLFDTLYVQPVRLLAFKQKRN